VHIVGLGIDPDNEALHAGLAATRGGRRQRALQMADGWPRSAFPAPLKVRCAMWATRT
jgi:hypothetical protein